MPTNPFQSPSISSPPGRAIYDPEDLGNLVVEYRVSRIVLWVSILLLVCSTGLCMLVTYEVFTATYRSIWEPLSVLAILLTVAIASALATASAARTRFAIFEHGIIFCSAFGTSQFRFAEVSNMQVNLAPLANLGRSVNPFRPHLVIHVGNPNATKYYIFPYLLSDFGLFAIAMDTWKKHAVLDS